MVWLVNACAVMVVATAALLTSSTLAQEGSAGKRLYDTHCANCHGQNGRGDGPLAQTTLKQVADLSTLAKRNGGVFPVADIEAMIDGRSSSEAHGPSDMPQWGQVFRDLAPGRLGRSDAETDYRNYVAARVKELVNYIETLQIQ